MRYTNLLFTLLVEKRLFPMPNNEHWQRSEGQCNTEGIMLGRKKLQSGICFNIRRREKGRRYVRSLFGRQPFHVTPKSPWLWPEPRSQLVQVTTTAFPITSTCKWRRTTGPIRIRAFPTPYTVEPDRCRAKDGEEMPAYSCFRSSLSPRVMSRESSQESTGVTVTIRIRPDEGSSSVAAAVQSLCSMPAATFSFRFGKGHLASQNR